MTESQRTRDRRRSQPRPKTLARTELRAATRAAAEGFASLLRVVEHIERPRTRGDCLPGGCNEERPCPWVSCSRHLYLEVKPETGAIQLNFPHLEVWELRETCAQDVADRGEHTLDEIGDLINVSRERSRQLEQLVFRDVRERDDAAELRELAAHTGENHADAA